MTETELIRPCHSRANVRGLRLVCELPHGHDGRHLETRWASGRKVFSQAWETRCQTHLAYEADYCLICGTTVAISERNPQ